MQDKDSINNWRDEFDDLEEEMKRISVLADNVGRISQKVYQMPFPKDRALKA